MSVVAHVVAALGLIGCGGSEDSDVDLRNGCDIRAVACQRALFGLTAELRGVPTAPMPPVRTISLDELARLVQTPTEPTPLLTAWNSALTLLGLLPSGSSIDEESASVTVAQVAAFYDFDTKQVVVIDRGASDPHEGVFVLSHEFAHALQDFSVGLADFKERWASSLDATVALDSLIEGEADALGFRALAKTQDKVLTPNDWRGFSNALHEALLPDIATASAPLFAARQGMPYVLGTQHVATLWLSGGQPAIDAAFAAPRLSALDWADDTTLSTPTRVEALDCLPTVGPPGFSGYDSDSFGATGLLAAELRAGTALADAWLNAFRIRGDRAIVFQEDGVSDSYAVAWRLRFDTEASAQRFSAALSARPSAGAASALAAREVLYFATSKPEKLATWTEVTHCGSADEVPTQHGMSSSNEPFIRPRWSIRRAAH